MKSIVTFFTLNLSYYPMYYLVTDGGSRGNPGPSACAWGVCNEDGWLFKDAMYLGEGTNNNIFIVNYIIYKYAFCKTK